MNQLFWMNFFIVLLTLVCVSIMLKSYFKQVQLPLSASTHKKLAFSGIVAFFMDTIGIGSFATNIAMAKWLRTFEDSALPGVVNGAQIIPGALEAFFFLTVIKVDLLTLMVLIVATCIGGIVGPIILNRCNTQSIRLTMGFAFPVIIALIFCNLFHLLPIGGNATSLVGTQLIYGFIGMFIAGSLGAAGVGLFALVQAILFCLGMSPLVAFPIMTAAGALQQPLTTMVMVYHRKVLIKQALIIGVYGVIGVLIALPIITYINHTALRILLIGILSFNTFNMWSSYYKHRSASQNKLADAVTTSS